MHQELRNNKFLPSSRQGFGILEIVIASAIIGGTIFAMISVFMLSRNAITYSTQKLQASYLTEEGIEAVRFLRDSGWANNIGILAAGTNYYLTFSTSTSKWIVSASISPDIDNLFRRSFQIENVSRDSSSNIQTTYSAVNDDPGTKKILMRVDWTYKNQNQSVSAETYITNLFEN